MLLNTLFPVFNPFLLMFGMRLYNPMVYRLMGHHLKGRENTCLALARFACVYCHRDEHSPVYQLYLLRLWNPNGQPHNSLRGTLLQRYSCAILTCIHDVNKVIANFMQRDEGTATGKTTFGQKMRQTGLHVYSDARILELTSRFKHMKFVREGEFGEVYVGNVGNQMVALKKAKDGVSLFVTQNIVCVYMYACLYVYMQSLILQVDKW